MNFRFTLPGTAAGWLLLSGCTPDQRWDPPVPVMAEKSGVRDAEAAPRKVGVSFTKSIRPILSNRCTICHNTQVLPKRPNFETAEGARRSGMIVPGNPEASRILAVVQEDPEAEKAMPPVSHRLTQEEIAVLRKWIAEGAHWPGGEAGRVKPAFIPEE